MSDFLLQISYEKSFQGETVQQYIHIPFKNGTATILDEPLHDLKKIFKENTNYQIQIIDR